MARYWPCCGNRADLRTHGCITCRVTKVAVNRVLSTCKKTRLKVFVSSPSAAVRTLQWCNNSQPRAARIHSAAGGLHAVAAR